MRYLVVIISSISLLLAVSVAQLYVSDSALLGRYLVFFAPEDLTYSSLSPGERITGDTPLFMPVASGAERTIAAELLRTPMEWTPGKKFEYNNVNLINKAIRAR